MYARVLAERLMHCRECLLFLAINIKRLGQTLSSVNNSNYCPLIWMFNFSSSYRKINELHERSLRLCHNDYTSNYDELLTKQGLENTHIRNIQQLMIEIFKCLQGPPVMNKTFILRHVPYTIRNPGDLDSQLPQTVYCGLETITYKDHNYGNNHQRKYEKVAS